jgi:two-component sensor histidine kinase
LIEDRTLLHLIVADKGSGKVTSSKGFGTRIMEGLVAQLGGKLTCADNLPGLRTVVIIPIQNPPR